MRWSLLVPGLEIPRGSQAVNLGWLLLVLGLEPLSKRFRGGGSLRLAVACLIGLRNCEACTMTSYSYGKASVNSLGGPSIGWEPQGISRAGQTVLAKLMES